MPIAIQVRNRPPQGTKPRQPLPLRPLALWAATTAAAWALVQLWWG